MNVITEEEDLPVIDGGVALSQPSGFKNEAFRSDGKCLIDMFSNERSNILHADSGLLLQALTTSKADDAFNLERLEMLGDAFLKQAVSIYLFCYYPDKDEGKLTSHKGKQIKNASLFKVARQRNLPGYIQDTVLGKKTWAPPCLKHVQSISEDQYDRVTTAAPIRKSVKTSYQGNGKAKILHGDSKQEDYSIQRISDKSVADSVEALIGAYLVSCGYQGALLFLNDFLGVKVSNTRYLLLTRVEEGLHGKILLPKSYMLLCMVRRGNEKRVRVSFWYICHFMCFRTERKNI
jgi:dsRNA-specific ribonuclease